MVNTQEPASFFKMMMYQGANQTQGFILTACFLNFLNIKQETNTIDLYKACAANIWDSFPLNDSIHFQDGSHPFFRMGPKSVQSRY